MSATTIVSEAFGSDANLYTEVLQLPSEESATPSQLRKAYYRQALKYHPDKQNGKSEDEVKDANAKFQAISVAYTILSDDNRRKIYDETGEMDDSDEGLDQSNTDAWKDYFKNIFGKVTTADIDKFSESYKCSEDEQKDVLKYYSQFNGNLKKMLECVMCSDEIDKKRWVEDYIKPSIERDEVEDYMEEIKRTLGDESCSVDDCGDETETENEDSDEGEAVKRTKATKRKKKPQPKSRKKTKTKKSEISEDLIASIRGRSGRGQGFGSVLAGLEERYSSKGKSKKSPDMDIPDDEFARIQQRLESKRKK